MINMMRDRDSHPTNTSVTSSTGLVHMRIRNVKASLKMRGLVITRQTRPKLKKRSSPQRTVQMSESGR